MGQALRKGDSLRGHAGEHGGHYDMWGSPIHPSNTVTGVVSSGSGNVFVNGMSAARVGDSTRESDPCTSGIGSVASGSGSVFINGRPAATKNSRLQEHAGSGSFTSGSGNVFIG